MKRLDDLAAFQLAVEFKLETYRLIRESPAACGDWRFRTQLSDAAASAEACLTEGWHRYIVGEFVTFLRYSRASLAEAEGWLKDGVARGHFTPDGIKRALELADQCGGAITNLRKSLEPFRKNRRRS